MNTRFDLHERIEEFLLFGNVQDDVFREEEEFTDEVEQCDEKLSIHGLKENISTLTQQYSNFLVGQKALATNLDNLSTKLRSEEEDAQFQQFMTKTRAYLQKTIKCSLLNLSKYVIELKDCKDIKQIPDIVRSIRNNAPPIVLPTMRIKALLESVIQNSKNKLLIEFHKNLEEQLSEEDSEQTNDSINESGVSDYSSSTWQRFLLKAKEWLLAYTLISILKPTLLNHSKSATIESFQECIDEALSPLWGRMYFHLTTAREHQLTNNSDNLNKTDHENHPSRKVEDSFQHLLWTFQYSKSFTQMMLTLCRYITSAEELNELANDLQLNEKDTDKNSTVNVFDIVAREYLLTKSLKMMRAHVASIISMVMSAQSDVLMLRLVEEILDHDRWLFQTSISHPLSSESDARFNWFRANRGILLSAVVYEAKSFFHEWMLFERSIVFEQVKVTDPDTAYKVLFRGGGDELLLTHEDNFYDEMESIHTSKEQSVQCYACIYNTMELFLNTAQRYQYFPAQAQNILSEVILEPLLCYLLGLLLYKIRSDSKLYHLSTKKVTNIEDLDPVQRYYLEEVLVAYKEFADSVTYLQLCLGKINASTKAAVEEDMAFTGSVHADIQRCRKRWSIIQNWMPKMLITNTQATLGFSILDLHRVSLKTSERFTSSTFEYRNISMESIQNYDNDSKGDKNNGQVSNFRLEECVQLIRGLAITLVDVLKDFLPKDRKK